MSPTSDVLNRYARTDGQLVFELVGGLDSLFGVRRGNKLVVGAGCRLALVGVARTYNRGVDKAIHPFLRHQQLSVVQLHHDSVTHHDIAHIHGEHIGAALLQQRSTFALLLGFLVVGTRLFLLFYLGTHYTAANSHLHAVYSCLGRHWEGVDGLQRVFPAIDIHLTHSNISYRTNHRGTDRGLFQRQLVRLGVFTDNDEIGR